MLKEKCREANINLRMCFIDYSKAFDCIGHREMIVTLKQMNCHYKITNLIINLYQEQMAAVRLKSGLTDWFPVKRGLRQGGILSPPIFSMYTETIMCKVEADGELTSFNAVNRRISARTAGWRQLICRIQNSCQSSDGSKMEERPPRQRSK